MEENNKNSPGKKIYEDARKIYEPSLIVCLRNYFNKNGKYEYSVVLSSVLQDLYEGIDIYVNLPNGKQLVFDSKAVTRKSREKYWAQGICNYAIKKSSYMRPTDNKYFTFADYEFKNFNFINAHFMIDAWECKKLIEEFGIMKTVNNATTKDIDKAAYFLLPRSALFGSRSQYIMLDGTILPSWSIF